MNDRSECGGTRDVRGKWYVKIRDRLRMREISSGKSITKKEKKKTWMG